MKSFHPLWRTYIFILVATLLFAGATIYFVWENIKKDARSELAYANSIMSNSMHSILNKYEIILQVLGERLIEMDFRQDSDKAINLINNMLKNNPELAGIGLANVNGELILTSPNINRNKLPNLLENPITSESFTLALQTDDLVMGRTYFVPGLNAWVSPIRYRITDSQGEVVAVMTSGLTIDAVDNLWHSDKLPDNIQLTVVRIDQYYQYISDVEVNEYEVHYENPVPPIIFNSFTKLLNEKLITPNFNTDQDIFPLTSNHHKGQHISALSYDSSYKYFIFTSSYTHLLYADLLLPLIWLSVLLLSFAISLFWVFRLNIKLEHKTNLKLLFQARQDPLTQLPNRRYLLDEFSHWQNQQKGQFSLLFIDLNNFKTSNDLHGHRIGDKILCEVAIRIIDTFTNCMVVRHGGDEFIVLTTKQIDSQTIKLSQKFLKYLSEPIVVDTIEFAISASIGMSQSPHDGTSIDELLRKSDMAMYEAKRLNSGVYSYSESLEEQKIYTAKIEKELSFALQNDEFNLVYQPQIDKKTNSIIGVEALLRWKNKNLGSISPNEFIPIAESTGLIVDIGLYVFKTALKEIIKLREYLNKQQTHMPLNHNKLRLSINVSVHQLLSSGFIDSLVKLKKQHKCSGLALMIEMTESQIIEELDNAKLLLKELQQTGIEISLDDFGTGYSSLRHLSKLPIDELKIDKSFIQDIQSNQQDRLLVKSIINLGKSLGIRVLAEGVENQQQIKILHQYHCDLFQGYYFAKPMAIEELKEYLI